MKIKEVKEIIENMKRLENNLSNLKWLSEGTHAAFPNKKKAAEISEKIANKAGIDMNIPYLFEFSINVVNNEINRLQNLIDEQEVEP